MPKKLFRVEVIILVRKKESIMTREYRATSEGQARQIALLIKGAAKVKSIVEIGSSDNREPHGHR